MISPGLQNGRPPDLLHQPDADDDDQTANVAGQQQVSARLETPRSAAPRPVWTGPTLTDCWWFWSCFCCFVTLSCQPFHFLCFLCIGPVLKLTYCLWIAFPHNNGNLFQCWSLSQHCLMLCVVWGIQGLAKKTKQKQNIFALIKCSQISCVVKVIFFTALQHKKKP